MLSRKYFFAGIKISKLFNGNLTAKYIKGDKKPASLHVKESKLESQPEKVQRSYSVIVCQCQKRDTYFFNSGFNIFKVRQIHHWKDNAQCGES